MGGVLLSGDPMAIKSPAARLEDAHSAYELAWLLDFSTLVPVPDQRTKQILRSAFIAGVLHGYSEANKDLDELERRMKETG